MLNCLFLKPTFTSLPMSQNNFVYPITPTNVPSSITEPSPAFKKMVTKVVSTIVLFFIVYLLMMVLSAALAVGCMYAGVYVIGGLGGFWGLALGIGMIGVGVLVFVFLIKFIFAVTKHDRAGYIEISEDQQPRLFAFIRQLTIDTQTAFPKRIYLTADVNAAVFYDSSFWSMFLPIKKNLIIGLGLVNSVNVSEFKAVMAHEFGHFSQRSMKLGSFIYNVNMIIHNMLFGNNSYGRFLQGWASLHGVFALFAHITAQIVYAIQWVLRQMYGVINKSNMELSREMEFHADAVAASVSGSKNLVTALRRLELGQSAYEAMLNKCNVLFREKKISSNIYKGQRAALRSLATEFKFPLQNEMAVIDDEFVIASNLTRVNYKDQWASHPSSEDRENHLNELAVNAEVVDDSAWVLFDNNEKVQEELTNTIYENAPKGDTMILSDREFEERFEKDILQQRFPKAYNGFYDNHAVNPFNVEEVLGDTMAKQMSFEEIFTPENALLSKKIIAIGNDVETLNAIIAGSIATKSFDFDGVKYKRQEAGTIRNQLEKEQKEMQDEMDRLDKAAIRYFVSRARQTDPAKAQELVSLYKQHFEYRKQAQEFLRDVNDMLNSISPIFQGHSLPAEEIETIISTLRIQKEPAFKVWLKKWIAEGVFDDNPSGKEWVSKYIQSDYNYFSGSSFFDNELIDLNEISEQSYGNVVLFTFRHFNLILEKQLSLMDAKVVPVT